MKATPEFMTEWRSLIRGSQFAPEIIRTALKLADFYEGVETAVGGIDPEIAEQSMKFLDELGLIALESGTYRLVIPGLGRTDEREPQETVLYHYYDAFDVLLYIGITKSLPRRQGSHESRSTWMDFAAWSTMEHFTTRADAEDVEQAAIRLKRPLFNVEHNDHPDRVPRLVDYLIERDRRDLLTPVISRG